MLNQYRLARVGESLKNYDVFKIDINVSTGDWYHLWNIKNDGVCTIMKHKQIMLSEYISEGGEVTASVNRITLNGNVMYQVVKRGLTACDVTLGYYEREDEAEAIAEESIINV